LAGVEAGRSGAIYWHGPVEVSTCSRHASASLLLIFVLVAVAGSSGVRSTSQFTAWGLSGSETPESFAIGPGIGGQVASEVQGSSHRYVQAVRKQLATHTWPGPQKLTLALHEPVAAPTQ
jgi:hypothetical protein